MNADGRPFWLQRVESGDAGWAVWIGDQQVANLPSAPLPDFAAALAWLERNGRDVPLEVPLRPDWAGPCGDVVVGQWSPYCRVVLRKDACWTVPVVLEVRNYNSRFVSFDAPGRSGKTCLDVIVLLDAEITLRAPLADAEPPDEADKAVEWFWSEVNPTLEPVLLRSQDDPRVREHLLPVETRDRVLADVARAADAVLAAGCRVYGMLPHHARPDPFLTVDGIHHPDLSPLFARIVATHRAFGAASVTAQPVTPVLREVFLPHTLQFTTGHVSCQERAAARRWVRHQASL